MIDYREICYRVCEVAQAAAEFIASARVGFTPDQVETKGDQNFVSYVDREAERLVVERLRTLLPQAGFITEENTVENCRDHQHGLQWIIDPLDGTTNFIHGLPPYCVSIALMEESKIVVGVVYEVTQRECFYAWHGGESYLNGRKISVSSVDTLKNALIAQGYAYQMEERMNDFLAQMRYFQLHTNGVRRIGSAAADLVYVACARVDAFEQINLSPWDVAAGALIVERAGGRVTDLSGGDNYVFGREIIATNGYLWQSFKEAIENCR